MLLTAAESYLRTHDLALPLPSGNQDSHLPVLVLTPANMIEAGLSDTKARIQQFAPATKGKAGVITVILKDEDDEQRCPNGLGGFMCLQAVCVLSIIFIGTVAYHFSSLFESDVSCPALPIPDVSSLFTTLDEYLKGLQQAPEVLHKPPIVTNLIAQATASAPAKPLSEHNANVVSGLFSSLQELEEATRTQQGQAKLCNYLDRATAKEMVDFWADEWIV